MPTIFAPVLFAGALHEEILPLPLAESPILVFEFVHANVALVGVLTKLSIFIIEPGQTAIFEIVFTVDPGEIVTVKVIGVPEHPLRVGVTVIVPTIFAPVLFAGALHEVILPKPLADIPIAVFELLHAKVAPEGVLTKLPIFIVEPGQTVIFEI